FIYEVDEELLKQNGVVAREVEIPEHPYESEISLRTSDGGTLPNEIVGNFSISVGKYSKFILFNKFFSSKYLFIFFI
ncbi:MAG: hypothetical protein KKE44_03675, partial [Proteobacteria bacterium]|nr:hypothetical protein [Pseudomonadota bacterium]